MIGDKLLKVSTMVEILTIYRLLYQKRCLFSWHSYFTQMLCVFFFCFIFLIESLKINAFLISYMAYAFGIWFGQLVYLFVSKIQPSEDGSFNSSIFEHLNGLAYPFCKYRIVFSLSKKYCMLFLIFWSDHAENVGKIS